VIVSVGHKKYCQKRGKVEHWEPQNQTSCIVSQKYFWTSQNAVWRRRGIRFGSLWFIPTPLPPNNDSSVKPQYKVSQPQKKLSLQPPWIEHEPPPDYFREVWKGGLLSISEELGIQRLYGLHPNHCWNTC
jgi:hypothetical protein